MANAPPRTEPDHDDAAQSLGILPRLLGIITEVRTGETATALLLTLNIFLLFVSYYIIKPVRDALILSMESGAEYKSYMSGAIALSLLFAVPAYSWVAKKLPRNRLIVGVTLFFVANLALFAIGAALPSTASWLPLVFYLWVGIFNMMIVAQFWAFAADVYDEEQGKRLFVLVAMGASLGAVAGSALSKYLPKHVEATLEGGCDATSNYVGYLDVTQLLLLAAAILAFCALLTQVIHRRETRAAQASPAARAAEPEPEPTEPEPKRQGQDRQADSPAPAAKREQGAFSLVFKHRYLTLLAAFALVFTLVNSNGEYMVGKLAKGWVDEIVASCQFADEATKNAFQSGQFASFFGDFYFYVNLLGVVLQTFVVSRLIKYGGVSLSLFVLPVIALTGAVAVAFVPALFVLRPSKIAENATDYSLNNTIRNFLWIPTTRAMKYRAKQAVDTFFVRMGDVGSGLLVLLGAQILGLGVRAFAMTNIVLVLCWVWIASSILREKKKLQEARERGELTDDA